jgi:hypothetical protein
MNLSHYDTHQLFAKKTSRQPTAPGRWRPLDFYRRQFGQRHKNFANRQAKIMMRIASEFGFMPSSRSRISLPSNSEPTLFEVSKGAFEESD